MSTDLEHLDDGEEAQVAWLLESGHDTPEMSHEFRAALGKRLDAEFALLHANGSHAAAPSLNGAMNGSAAPEAAEKELVEVAPQSDGESGEMTQRRPRRRWVISIVAAASVALAAAILSNPPAWAAAVRAIVQRIEQFTIGGVANDDENPEA